MSLQSPAFTIEIPSKDQTNEYEDPSEFESTRAMLEEHDVEYIAECPEWYDESDATDGGQHANGEQPGEEKGENGHAEAEDTDVAVAEVVDQSGEGHDVADAPESAKEMLQQAVVDWFGGRDSPFISEIDHGRSTSLDLNKDGTQLVANILDLEMDRECEVHAKDTGFEYCRYWAKVTRPDGKSFAAIGDAHIDEKGKDKWDLERLAETRAKKRAIKWASAGGVEALMQAGDAE